MNLDDAARHLTIALRTPRVRTMGTKPVVELDVDVAKAVVRALERYQEHVITELPREAQS